MFRNLSDLNFNMNKRQGTLFNFGVKKSRIEGVCDATSSDSSSIHSDLQDGICQWKFAQINLMMLV
jgi:hypothetical protein